MDFDCYVDGNYYLAEIDYGDFDLEILPDETDILILKYLIPKDTKKIDLFYCKFSTLKRTKIKIKSSF